MFPRTTRKKTFLSIAIFALVATTLLLITRAAGPFLAAEPENNSPTGSAVIGTDINASGGKYLQFKAAGSTGITYPLPLPDSGNFSAPGPTAGPLKVNSTNPRFLIDSKGRTIVLSGVWTWNNLVDYPKGSPSLDYTAYLNYIKTSGMNYMKIRTIESMASTDLLPYLKTSSGKYDLTQYDSTYFSRLHDRIAQARDKGIYVQIILFQFREDINDCNTTNPHLNFNNNPYNINNNINGIDGDINNDGCGMEIITQSQVPANILNLEKAYVKKVMDTVADLDNVLYEIAAEAPKVSKEWQYGITDYIHQYEATKTYQHPVMVSTNDPSQDWNFVFTGGNNDIAQPGKGQGPNNWGDDVSYGWDPPASTGAKVVLTDTDHLLYWGGEDINFNGGEAWIKNFVWKSFVRAISPTVLEVPPTNIAGWTQAGYPIYGRDNPVYQKIRNNLGYVQYYAERVNLAKMTPQNALCGSSYCLVNPSANGAEYLVYLPSGGSTTVNLSATTANLSVEWLNNATGAISAAASTTGGTTRTFTAPFSGDAVLYIKDSAIVN